MKRRVAMLLVCLLVAGMLAGCSHKHTYRTAADVYDHYEVCDACGDKRQKRKHDFDEMGYCSACNAEVMDMGDGSGSVFLYDQMGNLTEMADFDESGKIISSLRWEYTYDGEQIKSSKEYTDGVLTSEDFYQQRTEETDAFDKTYCAEVIYYLEDGTKELCKFFENGEMSEYTPYDKDGKPMLTEAYTYEYDEDGDVTKRTVTTDGKLSKESWYEKDEFEISYEKTVLYYDAEGKVIREEEYDSFGMLVYESGEPLGGSTDGEGEEDEEIIDIPIPEDG